MDDGQKLNNFDNVMAQMTPAIMARMVEQLPAAVVMTDTAGAITYVNPRFCKWPGYSFEEAIGQNPRKS